MYINGLQKLTLLDFPGHCACTVFFGGCNFRCPYCHNSGLIGFDAEKVMSDTEFLKFLEGRKGILDGVAVTGGEPLLTEGLTEFIRKIKKLGFAVKLDTNGSMPDRLGVLLSENLLDYVAMDIKNSREKYAETIGIDGIDFSRIEKSADLLMHSGIDFEFRTTVADELFDETSFEGIGRLISGAEKYFIQPFADRDTVLYGGLSAPSREKLEKYAGIMRKYVKNAEIRGI